MKNVIKSKLLIMFMLVFISVGFIGCGSKNSPTATTPTITSTTYVGSANSDKYHIPSCTSAKRIKESNLVEFTSKEDAESNGYQPCKICKP